MAESRLIVAIGGTLRPGSSTEAAMRRVLHHAAAHGAEGRLFAADALDLPLYRPGAPSDAPGIAALVDSLRAADAVILASPSYHGGVSGLVKNAIDYAEALARDPAPYLSGKPIGCIGTGAGWQGCNATLHALRSIAHALRGWPTPLGIAFNNAVPVFDDAGNCILPELDRQFAIMAAELVGGS